MGLADVSEGQRGFGGTAYGSCKINRSISDRVLTLVMSGNSSRSSPIVRLLRSAINVSWSLAPNVKTSISCKRGEGKK